jgi:diaminohydroxyphosphoribosylaminopyrimidine deaminase/5-amino-6-(5-phosphoribosylamino)uracil reductase
VFVAQRDPFAQVAGQGIAELERAGIELQVGLLESDAQALNAPYLKLLATGRPWVIAKWAMTLDGKLATRTGDSRWISSPASRGIVHTLRGRVDAIMVGRGTAAADDPLLTARPNGPRIATRVVLDSRATLPSDSQLVRTARDAPVLVAACADAQAGDIQRLTSAGCEVLLCQGRSSSDRLGWLLDELGRRQMTNVLVEGGSHLFGSLLDLGQIDEVHAFIAPKLIGGSDATPAFRGSGIELLAQAVLLDNPNVVRCGDDIYVHGRIRRV